MGRIAVARWNEGGRVRPPSKSKYRGFGLAEAVVLLVLVVLVVLLVIMALPRSRETARTAACQRNLARIGVALGIYAQGTDQYPGVPALGGAAKGPSPIDTLLLELGQADFSQMNDPAKPPPKRAGVPTGPRAVPGLTCPSDTLATSDRFRAPVSYRATAGDEADGRNGPFAPGKVVRVADVEAGDGLAYTGAFAERLVGAGRPGGDSLRNYALAAGPIGSAGCSGGAWRGDAGSSWAEAGWVSTLYNHALPPNAGRSCVADDGRTALMGASSAHVGRIHLLVLDGGVRAFTPTVDPRLWRRWGTIRDPAPASP
jgi:hypothetical protein